MTPKAKTVIITKGIFVILSALKLLIIPQLYDGFLSLSRFWLAVLQNTGRFTGGRTLFFQYGKQCHACFYAVFKYFKTFFEKTLASYIVSGIILNSS